MLYSIRLNYEKDYLVFIVSSPFFVGKLDSLLIDKDEENLEN